jgi:plasmid stability protein
MSKRLQVVIDEEEYGEIRTAAGRARLTVSEWVRRVLREARAATGVVREPESAYEVDTGEGVPLHIRSLPAALHRKLAARARATHRTVAGEAAHLLERALEEAESLSLLELEGLGAALWEGEGEDASDHVARERDAWN